MDHKDIGDNISAIGHLALAPFWLLAAALYVIQKALYSAGSAAEWMADRTGDLTDTVTLPIGWIVAEARKASMRARSDGFDEDI